MFWKPALQLSLRGRLLVILIPVLTIFSIASIFYAREDVVRATNAAYDRSLLGVIKSINLNVSNSSGGLSVELPYGQFELFELTASGNVYFKVSTLDGLVEVGNHDLPPPPVALLPGKPFFYDASYFGQTVRVGAYLHSESVQNRKSGEVTDWVIQVAESVQSRETFATALIKRAVVRDSVMLLLIWLGIGFGVAYGLKPILRLVRQVSGRHAADLTPLPLENVSIEFHPLIAAVNQQLQRTEKLMSERRSFIDDASHQLRTPLSVLQMQIDYALREEDPNIRNQALISLSNELGHAIRGTNQLLALAETDAKAVEMVPFELLAVVRQVALDSLPFAKAKDIDLGLDVDSISLIANGDPYLIAQALVNIVHNAIQHGNEGGTVTVSAYVECNFVIVKVVDDGPGMPDEIIQRIGQRFAKGRSSRGSGLGLSIARSVMTSHGGELVVNSVSKSSGTEVILKWPKS